MSMDAVFHQKGEDGLEILFHYWEILFNNIIYCVSFPIIYGNIQTIVEDMFVLYIFHCISSLVQLFQFTMYVCNFLVTHLIPSMLPMFNVWNFHGNCVSFIRSGYVWVHLVSSLLGGTWGANVASSSKPIWFKDAMKIRLSTP